MGWTTSTSHLRTLAKYGFVEEAGGGRGRERPWRQTYDGMTWRTRQDDPQASHAAEALDQVWMDRVMTRAQRSLTSMTSWPHAFDDGGLGASASRRIRDARGGRGTLLRTSADVRAGGRDAPPFRRSQGSEAPSAGLGAGRVCPARIPDSRLAATAGRRRIWRRCRSRGEARPARLSPGPGRARMSDLSVIVKAAITTSDGRGQHRKAFAGQAPAPSALPYPYLGPAASPGIKPSLGIRAVRNIRDIS